MSVSKPTSSKQLNLSQQYLNLESSDVFFICGNDEYKERVPAHKFILATNSDVFGKMFHGSLPEKKEIAIVDASPNGFRWFLRYFYFDEYMLNIDVVGEVMYLSKKYNIDEYFQACCEFLKGKKSAQQIILGYELAIAYELTDLKKFLEDAIHDENVAVFGCEYMRTISRAFLKCILQIQFIDIYGKQIFDFCMQWAEEACKNANIDPGIMENRRQQLGDCFNYIEFGAMKRDEIVKCINNFGDLFTSQELRKFVILIASKCPTPFNIDEKIKYHIGTTSKHPKEMQSGLMEELHFISQTKMVLGGFEIATITNEGSFYGLTSVVRVSSNNDRNNDILLLRGSVLIDAPKPKVINSPRKFLFGESIIVEPHTHYAIQLTFFCNAEQPTYMRAISPSEEYPFHILSETNSKLISGIFYNQLS